MARSGYELRFPLATTAELSCREVADIMTERGYPMTASCVSQIEARALQKLWQALRDEYGRSDEGGAA